MDVKQAMLQSIEDFIKEQEDAVKNVATCTIQPSNKPSLPMTKRHRMLLLQTENAKLDNIASKATLEMGFHNWVGRLQEYRNVHPTASDGLVYAEEVVGYAPYRFKCTAAIPESATLFGGDIAFINKKDAKRYASKKAIDWLIENKFMPADGQVKFPSSIKEGSPVGVDPDKVTLGRLVLFAGRIPGMCTRLGMSCPTYVLTKDVEEAPFWSGYAHFNGIPFIDSNETKVKGVCGKKNAKEEIAWKLLLWLQSVEKEREVLLL